MQPSRYLIRVLGRPCACQSHQPRRCPLTSSPILMCAGPSDALAASLVFGPRRVASDTEKILKKTRFNRTGLVCRNCLRDFNAWPCFCAFMIADISIPSGSKRSRLACKRRACKPAWRPRASISGFVHSCYTLRNISSLNRLPKLCKRCSVFCAC